MNYMQKTGIALTILLIFAPVLALIYGVLVNTMLMDNGMLELCMPKGRRLGLLLQSVLLAGAVAITSVLMAVLAGSFLWMRRSVLPMYKYLRSFILFMAVLPPYVHMLAWSTALLYLNSHLRQMGWPEIPFHGFVASWWVEVMAWMPLSTGLVLLGLATVNREVIESAKMMRKGAAVFKNIVLPLAAPGIIAGCGLVFLFSLLDYSVPSLFQVNTYAMEIFADYSAHNSSPRAFLLSVPLLFISAAVIYFSQAVLRRAVLRSPRSETGEMVNLALPLWFVKMQEMGMILLAVQILVPVISLLSFVRTGENLFHAVLAAQGELIFTCTLSVTAGLLVLPLAMIIAVRLSRFDAFSKWLWILVMLPLVLPAPLIGIGLIDIWNHSLPVEIYGTAAMPLLAALVRFIPIAVVIVFAQIQSIDPLFIDAAKIMQKNFWHTFIRIRLPLYMPGLAAAFSLVAVLTAGELGAAVLVAPPGQSTITIKIYNFLHYGASETVAGLCLLMLLTGLLAAGVASWLLEQNKST